MPTKPLPEKRSARPALRRYARWHPLPLEAVKLTAGFWAQRQKINRWVTLPHGYQMLEKAGNFENFRIAAGLAEGPYRGREFLDSDVYKWLEAAAYALHLQPDGELQEKVDKIIGWIAAAQQDDGYLNTYYQLVAPDRRWTDLDFGHELYCAGHLFQAAVAHYRATHHRKLLDVAVRLADYICSVFGPGQRAGAPGHPEIELALVELFRLTGRQAYLDLAAFFIDQRGQGRMRGMGRLGPEYHQDRLPVRQAAVVEGHAVRAMYLNAGVTDLYLETGEPALLEAQLRQWADLVQGKLHLTGGIGSRYEGESIGDAYELPPDRCYCETCAATGSIMWNWRLLQATGQGRFADLIERTLYNGFLSGLALGGKDFFYINPLLSRGGYQRQEWYKVACCPPNMMRLLASLDHYVATTDAGGVQIHLYNPATLQTEFGSGRPVTLTMATDYPWQGQVRLAVEETDKASWQLRLRLPGWCPEVKIALNGQPLAGLVSEAGYLGLERVWQAGDVVELSMALEPQLIEPHPRIDAVRGSLAIQRGPLVYCLEAIDVEASLADIQIDQTAPLQAVWREDLLPEGIMAIEAAGYRLDAGDWQEELYRPVNKYHHSRLSHPIRLRAIPYYAWANRGPHAMRVWIPARPVT